LGADIFIRILLKGKGIVNSSQLLRILALEDAKEMLIIGILNFDARFVIALLTLYLGPLGPSGVITILSLFLMELIIFFVADKLPL
jgi:hypothetical protein